MPVVFRASCSRAEISAGSRMEVLVPIIASPATVLFSFHLEALNVMFSAQFTPSGARADDMEVRRLPPACQTAEGGRGLVDAGDYDGELVMRSSGALRLEWSNTYSWFTPKIASYTVTAYCDDELPIYSPEGTLSISIPGCPGVTVGNVKLAISQHNGTLTQLIDLFAPGNEDALRDIEQLAACLSASNSIGLFMLVRPMPTWKMEDDLAAVGALFPATGRINQTNEQGRVIKLTLDCNDQAMAIPEAIGNFDCMQTLDLQNHLRAKSKCLHFICISMKRHSFIIVAFGTLCSGLPQSLGWCISLQALNLGYCCALTGLLSSIITP